MQTGVHANASCGSRCAGSHREREKPRAFEQPISPPGWPTPHAGAWASRYYRVDDCHEYAQQYHGLKGPVQWEGATLDAMPKELFFSQHPDENHADCILRTCTVLFHTQDFEPPADSWEGLKRHEYLVWRGYKGKYVNSLTDLPTKVRAT